MSVSRLKTDEQRFRQLFEAARQWVWEVDADGIYTYSNSVVKELLGYEPEEIVGKKHFYDLFSPRARDELKDSVFEAFARKEPIRGLINENVHKNGSAIQLLTNGLPLLKEDGSLAGYRGVDTDVTEQKMQEQQIRETNVQLSKSMARLKNVQNQIVQNERLSALLDVASGISHRLNNALTPILGLTDLLISFPDMLDTRAKAVSMLKMIRAAGVQASETVHRLSSFCSEPDEMEMKPVDLEDLINDAINRIGPKCKDRGDINDVAIRAVKECRDIRPVNGNRQQLTEMLTDIVFNAVEAMPGGGTLTISAQPDKAGRDMEIRVSDTGSGMNEQVRMRSFEPFFTTKGSKAAGLGLAIAYGVVRRHGGGIDIKSAPGKGTTVTVHLPLAERREEYDKKPTERSDAPASLRVLFADDEESIRNLIDRYLRLDKHAVDLVADGEEAVRKLKEKKYDLVITDWAMPGVNGERVAAAAKAIDSGVPVILLTGFGDSLARVNKLPEYFDMIINKPVTRDAFRSAIAEVMGIPAGPPA